MIEEHSIIYSQLYPIARGNILRYKLIEPKNGDEILKILEKEGCKFRLYFKELILIR